MPKNFIKNDISTNWNKANFIPKEKEIIVYTDILKLKIGDGKTRLVDLPFVEKKPNIFNGLFNLEKG